MNHISPTLVPVSTAKKVSFTLGLTLVVALFWIGIVQQALGASQPLDCTGFPMSASNEAELQEAIDCFNAETTAGTYTINLSNDIALTASLGGIDNVTQGAILELDGNSFTIDGQDTAGLRPLAVFTDTVASFVDLTVTGGNVDSITDASRNRTSGGAIINFGSLTLDNVTIVGNSSEDWGGGIFSEEDSTLVVRNSTIQDNSAGEDGGGIQNFGDMTIEDSLIYRNSAGRFSGGIGINAPLKLVEISDSQVISNTANQDGAGIYSRNATTIVSNSVITGNVANRRGGGIFNNRATAIMTVTNTVIEENYAKISGAGVHNNENAILFISSSSISNNLVNVQDKSAEGGGGLRNERATATVQNTTFSGNTSRTAVANVDGSLILNHVTVAETSISGATSVGVKNFAPTAVDQSSQLWIYNSALADNPVDCQIEAGSTLEASVGNLIETDSAAAEACSDTDTLNVDPQFMPFGENGGATATYNFPGTSPLLDSADATACADLIDSVTDQRGVPRPQGLGCDIGALESTIEISVNDVSIVEGNDGTQNMVFTISRNRDDIAFTVVVNTEDGTAKAGSDYEAITNQTVSFGVGGSLTQDVNVVINGDIEFEGDETFSLVLSNPSSGLIALGTGTGTIQENQTIELSVTADASVDEGDTGPTFYIFTFTLQSSAGGSVTVGYSTSDNTATVGSGDYEATSGNITLDGSAGAGGAESVSVMVFGDEDSEPDEIFNFEITSISNPSVGAAPLVTEAIIKNDDDPEVSFTSASFSGVAGGNAIIELELEIPATETSTVVVTSQDGTAEAGSDYTAVNQTVTFNVGESTKTISIPLASNTSEEGEESFTLSLSNYTNIKAGSITTTEVTIGVTTIYLPYMQK